MSTELSSYMPPRVVAKPGAWMRWCVSAPASQIAYHEAAHAVVGMAVGCVVTRATIRPRKDILGQVRFRAMPSVVNQLGADRPGIAFHGLVINLAGLAAEELWFQSCEMYDLYESPNETGWSPADWLGDDLSDTTAACTAARYSFGDEHCHEFMGLVARRVGQFLNTREARLKLGQVARLLHERKTIGAEIAAVGAAADPRRLLSLSKHEAAAWASRLYGYQAAVAA